MFIQIMCVNKTDRYNPHERISYCGGIINGARWRKSQQQVVSDIENGINQYHVKVNYRDVRVIVAVSKWGNKYIKTIDGDVTPDNLLSLPECPLF